MHAGCQAALDLTVAALVAPGATLPIRGYGRRGPNKRLEELAALCFALDDALGVEALAGAGAGKLFCSS